MIMFSRPGLKSVMKKRVASISEVHLKIIREHGTLLLYGVKPRTGIYVVEIDTSKGYAIPKLTPIA